MSSSLPQESDLRHLKLQAKTLLKSARDGDNDAEACIQATMRESRQRPVLADALHAIAHEYGFASWARLKIHVELASKAFDKKLEMFLSSAWLRGDGQLSRLLLDEVPELAAANIYTACAVGDEKTAVDLLKSNPSLAVETGGPRGWCPLLYATWSCFLPDRTDAIAHIVRLLLDHGADPNSFWTNDSDWKESALYGCVEYNNVTVARVLIDAGADPNDTESLYHACEKHNIALLDTLAINELDTDSISYCIKHAMDFRWTDGIRWFLDHGADPDAVHPEANETSLHWAVKRNCPVAVIESLLEHGADPNAHTKEGRSAYLHIPGWTPYDYALRLGLKEIARVLTTHGAIASPQLDYDRFVIAAANNYRGTAEALKDEYASTLTDGDRNLIAHVAQMGNWDGIDLMLDMGWPIDVQGWMGATPLYWALCFGHADAVKRLLQRGASTDPVDGYFQHPLHTVVHCRWDDGTGDYPDTLERLLDHGVRIPDGFYPCGQADMDRVLERFIES
ncbi:MAG TPA: hypothetical protein DIT99_06460 [Candidatus Latescibacteria bacterium]|nr:hypothetical protein [Candidatus Latescibacterota bacterium]